MYTRKVKDYSTGTQSVSLSVDTHDVDQGPKFRSLVLSPLFLLLGVTSGLFLAVDVIMQRFVEGMRERLLNLNSCAEHSFDATFLHEVVGSTTCQHFLAIVRVDWRDVTVEPTPPRVELLTCFDFGICDTSFRLGICTTSLRFIWISGQFLYRKDHT